MAFKEYGEQRWPSLDAKCCGVLKYTCGVTFPTGPVDIDLPYTDHFQLCRGEKGHVKESTNRFICIPCSRKGNWCELCADAVNFGDDFDAVIFGRPTSEADKDQESGQEEIDVHEEHVDVYMGPPSPSSSPPPTPPPPKNEAPDLLHHLLDMGFAPVRAAKAASQHGDISSALGWLDEHKDDPDIDDDPNRVIDPVVLGGIFLSMYFGQCILVNVFTSMYSRPCIFVNLF